MKMRFDLTVVGLMLAALLCGPTPVLAAALMGPTAGTFAVLGASTVTNTGETHLTGNLGVSPGTAITGSPIVAGTVYHAGPVAAQGQADIGLTYGVLDGLPCDVNLSGKILGTSVGATTLTPGVYCFNSGAQLTGTLTLDSQGQPDGIWVFQIGATLTTAADSQVVMAPNSNAGNVFWQVTSSATIGTNSTFKGNLIALISVTLTTGVSVDGRVFARTGAVTMDTNTIGIVPFVPSLPKLRLVGYGAIPVPRPNNPNPAATGTGSANFHFVVQRNVPGGPVTGFFDYVNPVQRVHVVGNVTDLTVLSRNPDGSAQTVLMEGHCNNTVPQCTFAVTVEEDQPGLSDQLGITVAGALHEVRRQRIAGCSPLWGACYIRFSTSW